VWVNGPVKLLTTAEVASKLGIHRSRVNVLIKEGRLPAHRFGRAFLVEERQLRLVEVRQPGRPRTTDRLRKNTSQKPPTK
jgi:excisionase family DNA binding protein